MVAAGLKDGSKGFGEVTDCYKRDFIIVLDVLSITQGISLLSSFNS